MANLYPVKAMFVMAANPALICANSKVVEEALSKLEFLVVTDIFMMPTAELADIVLPACTFLKKTRFVAYDPHVDHGWNVPSRIALSPKVVEPLEESWSDWKIILITDCIDPRVVHLYHGFKESNCNVLTDHKTCDPLTGSAKLFDQTFLKFDWAKIVLV